MSIELKIADSIGNQIIVRKHLTGVLLTIKDLNKITNTWLTHENAIKLISNIAIIVGDNK